MNTQLSPSHLVSALVVNFHGGRFVQRLLWSLKRTVADGVIEKVVVVNNRLTPYRGDSRYQRLSVAAKHYLKVLMGRYAELNDYNFDPPGGLTVERVLTSPLPVFNRRGVRGKAVSISHTLGLAEGYKRISSETPYVLILDQDVAFLKRGWIERFVDAFAKDPNLVLIGAFRDEKIYARPFLRPYCLMFRRSFYSDFGDVFRPTPQGDSCSALTYLCEDHGKHLHLFRNSLNHSDVIAPPLLGEVAIDEEGEIFVAHRGHNNRADNMGDWLKSIDERMVSI
jgi:hypothetical protein